MPVQVQIKLCRFDDLCLRYTVSFHWTRGVDVACHFSGSATLQRLSRISVTLRRHSGSIRNLLTSTTSAFFHPSGSVRSCRLLLSIAEMADRELCYFSDGV